MAIVFACLLVSASVDARMLDGPPDESASVARAWQMMKQGGDQREVVAMVEPLAYFGDSLAQLLLGAIYFDGRDVPRDVVQGYAWLKIAAKAADATIAKRAQAMLLTNERALSGVELIRADERVATIESTMVQRICDRLSPGLSYFTSERPITCSNGIRFGTEPVQLSSTQARSRNFQLGCAVSGDSLCPPQSRSVEPRCTGQMVRANAGPSLRGDGVLIVKPQYPPRLRQSGVTGKVIYIAHVDRSGWVCGAAVAESSGDALLDKQGLAALVQWRLKPAMRRDEPVEALHPLSLDFTLHDD